MLTANSLKKFAFGLAVASASVLSLSSCKNDDDQQEIVIEEHQYSIPATYNFYNASYGGQTTRLSQLGILSAKLKEANTAGTGVDSAEVFGMYAGDDAFLGLESGGKQLKNKTEATLGLPKIEEWLGKAVKVANTEDTLVGKRISSLDGKKTYIVDATNGFEYAQLIEKGLMGAAFYYQATSGYLEEVTTDNNTDTIEGENYTARQHHFDEAFGYFGAPADLSESNVLLKKEAGELKFHAGYSLKAFGAGLSTIDDIMSAFIAGRAAIDNNHDEKLPSQITIIKNAWEQVIYTSAIHYLNSVSNNFDDTALRCHELSEARGFIWSLNFNVDKNISASEIKEVLALLGDSNFTVTKANVKATKDKLVQIFKLDTTTADAL